MAKKVLEAKLVKPTTHKEESLDTMISSYRDALHNGLAIYERSPDLLDNILSNSGINNTVERGIRRFIESQFSNEVELDNIDEYPFTLIKPELEIDMDTSRENKFCWKVPTAEPVWIPLKISESQEEYWENIFETENDVQRVELHKYTNNWVLRVIIHTATQNISTEPNSGRDVNEQFWLTDDSNRTPIGVDIGETYLVAGCALNEDGKPEEPVLVDGRKAKHLRKEMYTVLKRLKNRDVADWRIENQFKSYRQKLVDIIEKASREIIQYSKQYTKPVVVLEDLEVGGEKLKEAMFEHRRLNMWSFNHLQKRIAEKANAENIPIAFVSPERTSKTCHVCRQIGERNGSFECTNTECWVTTYQSDINAAANLTHRYDPWGEKCPVKVDTDDSPRDGSPCDGTRKPRNRDNSLERTLRNDFQTQPAGHWSP